MNEIKQNSPYAWFLAARPKTLTGAIIPVLLGSALAFSDGQFTNENSMKQLQENIDTAIANDGK